MVVFGSGAVDILGESPGRLVCYFQDFTTCSPAFFTLQLPGLTANKKSRSTLRENVVVEIANCK